MRTLRPFAALSLVLFAAFAATGCSILMDFDLCENHDDCHQFEGRFALVCRSGNCVQANCHSSSDCPGSREYVCVEQKCLHREDHGHEDAGEHDGEEHDGGDHGDAHDGEDGSDDASSPDVGDAAAN